MSSGVGSTEPPRSGGGGSAGPGAEREHPNAALVRRLFAAFGKDAMVVSAALARDVVWRVPGNTVMSGEYRGRRDVVEFLRRTGLETGGTVQAAAGRGPRAALSVRFRPFDFAR